MQSFETSGTIAGINSTKPPSSGANNVSEPRLTSQVGSAQSYARRSVCFCNKSGGSASNVLHAYQLKSCEWASTAMSVVRLALRIVVHRLTSKMSQIFCVYFIIIIIIYLACRNWADTRWRQYIILTLLIQITAMWKEHIALKTINNTQNNE